MFGFSFLPYCTSDTKQLNGLQSDFILFINQQDNFPLWINLKDMFDLGISPLILLDLLASKHVIEVDLYLEKDRTILITG